jgi:hypothetical protein
MHRWMEALLFCAGNLTFDPASASPNSGQIRPGVKNRFRNRLGPDLDYLAVRFHGLQRGLHPRAIRNSVHSTTLI